VAEGLAGSGDLAAALQAATEGRRLFAGLEDGHGIARADYALAVIRHRQGEPAAAEASYQQALAALEQTGDARAQAALQLRRARFLEGLGSSALAEDLEGKAMDLYRHREDPQGVGEVLLQRAERLRRGGDPVVAERALRQALVAFQDAGDDRGQARTQLRLAALLAARERLLPARAAYREAIALQAGPELEAAARAGLAEMMLLAGELQPARREQEAALALRRRLADPAAIARSQLALAALDLEEGWPGEAAALVQEVLKGLRERRDQTGEVIARTLLARAQLAQGEVVPARRSVDTATSLAGDHPPPEARLSLALVDSQVAAAEGNRLRAEWLLDELQKEVLANRQIGPQLEVRLALGRLQLEGGDRDQGQALLRAVSVDATARGYGLLATRAATLLATSSGG
jgi:tetratricopeptide (TPR) repeat protein